MIERLQAGQGGASFNNMFATIGPIDDLPAALLRAHAAGRRGQRVGW